MKEAQVHSVQLLTFPTDIPIGVFYSYKCGTEADIIVRLNIIYQFLQCCTNCLQQAIESGTNPVCTVWSKECFSLKRGCENHKDNFTDWRPDNKACLKCALMQIIGNTLNCHHLRVPTGHSDMAPSYHKAGKKY